MEMKGREGGGQMYSRTISMILHNKTLMRYKAFTA